MHGALSPERCPNQAQKDVGQLNSPFIRITNQAQKDDGNPNPKSALHSSPIRTMA